jgi:hypothetical protein
MIVPNVGGSVEVKNVESLDTAPEVAAFATAVARLLSRMLINGESTEK